MYTSCQIKFRVLDRCHLLDWLFWLASCSVLLYMDELERGCLFHRNTLVGVTTIGDRSSWLYPINLGPLKCTRPPSSREGVRLSVLVPLFCGCQCLVWLSLMVSVIVHSNSSIQEGFGQHFYIYGSPCSFLRDSEDVYLSRNASSRNWSTSGQCSNSSANARSMGGSSGRTKSVILVCPGLAFCQTRIGIGAT